MLSSVIINWNFVTKKQIHSTKTKKSHNKNNKIQIKKFYKFVWLTFVKILEWNGSRNDEAIIIIILFFYRNMGWQFLFFFFITMEECIPSSMLFSIDFFCLELKDLVVNYYFLMQENDCLKIRIFKWNFPSIVFHAFKKFL